MHSEPKKSVLVTGGRGFIGRAVVKLLRCLGYQVLSLDRAPLPEILSSENVEEVCFDLKETDCLRGVFERNRITGIVHLAAILPTAAQRNPLLATEVNISGSLNLLEMARQFRVERFVFGSSLSIYGTYPANQMVSEAEATLPKDLYGAAKLYVEQLGRAYHQHYGLGFVSLRIGRVLGPGANSISSAWRSEIFELVRSEHRAEIFVPYRPSERILVLHVDDVAEMLLALLRAPRTKHAIYNAPCESILVGDLKRVVENLNPNITVKLGDGRPTGNPQMLDFSRFQKEFPVETIPIFDRLRRAAGK